MKLTFVITTLLLFTIIHASAQQKRDTIHHAAATQKKAKLKDELQLDKKQTDALKTSKNEYKQKAKEVKSDSTLSKKERKAQVKKLKKEQQEKFDAVLTPEQREKEKQLKKEKHDKKGSKL